MKADWDTARGRKIMGMGKILNLEIRINQHIPSSIQTHTSDCTTTPNTYNSTSAISGHRLANQTSACVFSSTMFTILETSTNELQLSILEALLILKNTNRNYISKSNPMLHCFLITFSNYQKKTSLTLPTLLADSIFFSIIFSSPLLDLSYVKTPCLLPLAQNQLSLTII